MGVRCNVPVSTPSIWAGPPGVSFETTAAPTLKGMGWVERLGKQRVLVKTDRYTDRQTDTQTNRYTDRQIHRQTDRYTNRYTHRMRVRHTHPQME